jgi:hypothetical protein
LITKEEVGAVQGTIISNTASSESASGDYLMTQCYYASIGPNLSVSLAINQTDPKNPSGASVREYWRQTFGRFYKEGSEEEITKKGRVGEGKREQPGPPKRIDGIGEEAFWSGNRFGGAGTANDNYADQFWSLHRRVPGPQRSRALNRRKLENRSH